MGSAPSFLPTSSISEFGDFQLPTFGSSGGPGGGYFDPIGSSNSFFGGTGGQNQYMTYPSMGNPYSMQSNVPGTVPQQGGYNLLPQTGGYGQWSNLPSSSGPLQGVGESITSGGLKLSPTLDPYLTQNFANYLTGQIGQGVQPFNLSSILPSTGGTTSPGQLSAPLTPLMQQLQQFFQGQGPGVTGTASPTGGTSGSPLNYVLPMWQSEISSMNLPIQQQFANLKEQFGSMGLLDSSASANALTDFSEQTAADQESLLGQLTLQALPQEEQTATSLQGIDQASIDRLVQQFNLDQPQNNPLLNMIYGLSTTFPPAQKKQGGLLSGLLGGIGSLIPGIGSSVAEGLSGGGGLSDVISSVAGGF